MKALTPLTHEEHVELAKKTIALRDLLHEINNDLNSHYPKSSKIRNTLNRLMRDEFQLRSHLDDNFHSVTTDEQYGKTGYVYYGGKTEPCKSPDITPEGQAWIDSASGKSTEV